MSDGITLWHNTTKYHYCCVGENALQTLAIFPLRKFRFNFHSIRAYSFLCFENMMDEFNILVELVTVRCWFIMRCSWGIWEVWLKASQRFKSDFVSSKILN